MKRLVAAAGLLVLALAAWWAYRHRPVQRPRNVILITIDTLRADRLGSYGSTRGLTPHLDVFASEGVRFAKAWTPVPLTGPSHATMLTGRYPITHGLRNNGSEVLPQDETLVSEILHERGFRTAAVVSALVLSSDFGLDQGFDLYYEKDIKGSERGHGLWYDQRPADKTVDRTLSWVRAERDHPFFLWMHLFDPHDPYDPPSPYKERYAKAPYDGEIAFTDSQVGRFFDELKALGLYDDALIIVSGDHGEGLGEHGELYHAIFTYDSTTHVPLLLRLPGGRGGGRVVTDLASTMDITPTVLDALGIPMPDGIEGFSLLEAAAGTGRVPARSLYLETIYPSASYGWSSVRALLTPEWKLIDVPEPELYDIADDPDEKKNLYASQPARVATMRAEFGELQAELERDAHATQTASIDDETRDRLMSLGYISGQQSKARTGEAPDPKKMVFMMEPLNIAQAMLKKRKFADAEEVFRKALSVDPDNKIALIKIAQSLFLQGRLDEAIPYFEHAIETYPDGEEFYRTYGWCLLRGGRLDAAGKVFRRALEHLPESGHMHFLLGYVLFLEKDWTGAQQELDLAVRLAENFGKPYYLLAICRLQEGDEDGALEAVERYLERDADVDSLFNDPYLEKLRRRPEFEALLKKFL